MSTRMQKLAGGLIENLAKALAKNPCRAEHRSHPNRTTGE